MFCLELFLYASDFFLHIITAPGGEKLLGSEKPKVLFYLFWERTKPWIN